MRPAKYLALSVVLTFAACHRKPKVEDSGDPAFEAKWSQITTAGADMFMVEPNGEALMGNVRRATRPATAPAIGGSVLPLALAGDQVQSVIRGNLAALRGCYQSLARHGGARSGKAIVTFSIGSDGRPADVKVDAPSFAGTPLPNCLGSQISFWAFPKSQKGGGVVSYPFVFVSG